MVQPWQRLWLLLPFKRLTAKDKYIMMHNFKNILIVVDSKTRSQVLLERGAALAQRNQSCLTVWMSSRSCPALYPR